MKFGFFYFIKLTNAGDWISKLKNGVKTIAYSIITAAILFIPNGIVSAQQAFTPLKMGEYEIKEEDTSYHPGAKIEGTYRVFYDTRREGMLFGTEQSGKTQQDIELRFQSKINTNLSLNVTLGNRSTFVSSQDTAYETRYADEQGDASDDDGMDVVFEEAYLEYNHNPNARLKIGKQYINVGDGKGLIYQGRVTAISQGCRIGTWCYYIGGARLGDNGDSSLIWAQLDYPVYESGVLVSDPWSEKGSRQEVSFNVEVLRTVYRGINIPVSSMGIWTGENSTYHDATGDSNIYFDNSGTEYIGFNLDWNFYNFVLDFTWLNLSGEREYFAGSADSGEKTSLGEQNVSGNAYLLEMDYRLLENWKMGFTAFISTGNELNKDGTNFWENQSNAYMEVQKGNYGDALIYFNGTDGIGEGHSVSNLVYYSLRANYASSQKDLLVDFALFAFQRNEAVYVNEAGEPNEKAKNIGYEFDIAIKWQLEKQLFFDFFIAVFQPQEAYTPNDNVRPVANPEDFSMLGFGLRYDF